MDAAELVKLAMAKTGETTVRGFAKRVGVSHVAVGYWIAGTSVPTFEQAAELAALASLPIIKTASQVRMHSPEAMKHKSILKQMAGTAALLLVLVLPYSAIAKAQDYQQAQQAASLNADAPLCIMRNKLMQ